MRVFSAACLFVLAGCGERAVSPAIQRAIDVWERGAEAIPAGPKFGEEGHTSTHDAAPVTPFSDFDQHVREFLEHPSLCDAVQERQRGAVIEGAVDWEAWVERGLSWADELGQLRALVVLMRVRAPRSVDKQWAALGRLSQGPRAAEFAPVTTRLQAAFAPAAIARALAESLPANSVRTTPSYQWWVRAAGVSRHRGMLARLTELVRTGPLDAALAAERSLEDFVGAEGDAALAACVVGLPSDAALAAATALLARDRTRLHAALLAAEVPDRMRPAKQTMLGR